jgi:hypothetical protein
MATKFKYTARDGTEYPLREAKADLSMKLYRTLRKKSVQGHPLDCYAAKSACKNPNIKEGFFGSGGDAYLLFKPTDDDPAHAEHFKLRAAARKVIDDVDLTRGKNVKNVITIILHKPAPSWTIAARQESNARRRAEIAAGSPVRRRSTPSQTRVTRMGLRPRPRAHVSRTGNIDASNL